MRVPGDAAHVRRRPPGAGSLRHRTAVAGRGRAVGARRPGSAFRPPLPPSGASPPSPARGAGGCVGGQSTAPPSQSTGHRLCAEAVSAAACFGNTSAAANRDAHYVIVSPHGTHPDGFSTAAGNFRACHDYTGDATLSGGAVASPTATSRAPTASASPTRASPAAQGSSTPAALPAASAWSTATNTPRPSPAKIRPAAGPAPAAKKTPANAPGSPPARAGAPPIWRSRPAVSPCGAHGQTTRVAAAADVNSATGSSAPNCCTTPDSKPARSAPGPPPPACFSKAQPATRPIPGGWPAKLDGATAAHSGTLAQTVSIPAACSSAPLGFWLDIKTSDPADRAYGTLKVELLNSGGTVLKTLTTLSNLSATGNYAWHAFRLGSFIGQTVTIKFIGTQTLTGRANADGPHPRISAGRRRAEPLLTRRPGAGPPRRGPSAGAAGSLAVRPPVPAPVSRSPGRARHRAAGGRHRAARRARPRGFRAPVSDP
jgi:hypothetical protein